MDFSDHNKDCPWHNNEECLGMITYNQHVNDPRYDKCYEYNCPIFYWVGIILELNRVEPNTVEPENCG